MPIDVVRAVEHLRTTARKPSPPPGGWPPGAPEREYTRSPAAVGVGRLAAGAGLFHFHFEHRAHLPLPEAWLPDHALAFREPPEWEGGVLPERKYQSFRHDLAVASFHPGHRAKWATHELCHALVGFGWRADAAPLFHATAGRLAELLPVALWYFLDEAFLRRCPVHAGSGALFRAHCAQCEATAACDASDAESVERLTAGARFFDRELAAIARTRQLRRPIAHGWASLDLCSDGLAYAAAHRVRLDSEAFRRFADGMLVESGGWSTSLDALEARVIAVARSVAEGRPLEPLAPSAEHGRWRWTLQDIGYRLWTVWADCDGEVRDELERLAVDLSDAVAVTVVPGADPRLAAEGALARLAEGYTALCEDYVLPDPEVLWAVGYDLPVPGGRSVECVTSGVRSATPLAARLLGKGLVPRVARFVGADRPERAPLAARWARFLADTRPDAIAELAAYEAALGALAPADAEAMALGTGGVGTPVRLARGAQVLVTQYDVVDLARLADFGDLVVRDGPGGAVVEDVDGEPLSPRASALVLARDEHGEPLLVDVSPETGARLQALGDGARSGLRAAEERALRDLGLLVPVEWPVVDAIDLTGG